MSFIFKDKDFLKLIHKMADEETPAMTTTLFNKIFNNLKQVSSPKESSLLSGEKGFESATIPSLSSLADCLEHIKLYKGEYYNQEIVLSGKPIQQDITIKPYQNYLVYADGLKVYLEFLFTSPDYKSKALYREMLGKLIDEANKAFGLGIKLPDWAKQPLTTTPTSTAAPGSEKPETGGSATAITPQAMQLLRLIANMLQDDAPFYDEDGIIFRLGNRGILPFLEAVDLYRQATNNQYLSKYPELINQFKEIQRELDGIDTFIGSTPISDKYKTDVHIAHITSSTTGVRENYRTGVITNFINKKHDNFVFNMQKLLELSKFLCDITKIDKQRDLEINYYNKMTFIKNKYNYFEQVLIRDRGP